PSPSPSGWVGAPANAAATASARSAPCWTRPTPWKRACALRATRSRRSPATTRTRCAGPCRRSCASACGRRRTPPAPSWRSWMRCATRWTAPAPAWSSNCSGSARPAQGTDMPRLLLASTSRYRRELLQRLRLPFGVARPDVDETALPGEAPRDLAVRLAAAKAQAVAQRQDDDAWVLGSDQVAEVAGRALGKPGGREAAIAQLRSMSGRVVRFHTALCLAHADGRAFAAVDLTEVHFRALADAGIERYVDAEQPFDCAGSFKSEGLGT